jgi:hypothetical protein
MCVACYNMSDKFYSPPPPLCGRCGKPCDKQIGKWAAIYYDWFGFHKICCQCFLLLRQSKQGEES